MRMPWLSGCCSLFLVVAASCDAPAAEGEGEATEGEGDAAEGEGDLISEGEGEGGAPDTSFVTAPADGDSNANVVFALACDAGSCAFECSLDGAGFAACDASVELVGLSVASHTFAARAVRGGIVDDTPATLTWTPSFGWRTVVGTRRSICAIAGDGGLYCQGTPPGLADEHTTLSLSRPTRVGDRSDWRDIAAGDAAICVKDAASSWACFGFNYYGLFGDPDVAEGAYDEPVAVDLVFDRVFFGADHGCGLDDAGALSCWGQSYYGELGNGVAETLEAVPTPVLGDHVFVDVALGDERSCAIDVDGALFCWGLLDDSDNEVSVTQPLQIGTDSDWVSLTGGGAHNCGLKEDGTLWCVGANYVGQLGDGSTTSSPFAAVQVGSDTDWHVVHALADATCAAKDDGRGFCWGENGNGQLGVPSLAATLSTSPLEVMSGVSSFGGRNLTACAIGDDGAMSCWGENLNANGALGRGIAGQQDDFGRIDDNWASIDVSDGGGCGIDRDGHLLCWGLGFHVGQQLPLRHTPTRVNESTGWTAVAVNVDGSLQNTHACGINDGAVFCWGSGDAGQLGDGTATFQSTPVPIATTSVTPGARFTQITTGINSSCAITDGGELYCWGGGTNLGFGGINVGQLGNGTTTQANTPVQVTVPSTTGWTSVHLQRQHASAVRDDHTLWAFGSNSNGTVATTPTQLGTDTDWSRAISQQQGATCAQKTDGTLWCNAMEFTPGFERVMQPLGSETSWIDVANGPSGTCAVDGAGAVRCFTNNGTGEGWRENLTTLDAGGSVPKPTMAAASWHGLFSLRCILNAAGERFCAGRRSTGNFGDGVDERVPTPVLLP